MDSDAKLNLLVGTRCNNRCVFCLDHGGEALAELDGAVVRSYDEAIAAMRTDRDRGATALAYGRLEVALDPAFPELVRQAKALGYTSQHLSTNGRVMSNRRLVDELLEAGIDYVTLSIHAPDPEIHDRLAGRKRAFEQAKKGIENLVDARRERPLRLAFATTITALNVHLLAEHYAFLQRYTPSYVGLNSLLYSGRGAERADELSFSYERLAEELRRLLRVHAHALYTRFAVVGVPYCELRDLPTEIVGLREAFRMPRSDDWVETGAAGEDGFAFRQLPVCRACSMRRECPGVADGYLDRHGDGGIDALDDRYRERLQRESRLFSAGRCRYPVSDPSLLPLLFRHVGAILAKAAGPDWTLRGVKAFADERQVAFRLSARYARNEGGEMVVDVEPLDPQAQYFASAGAWGVTLGESGDERFSESEARSREALVERLKRLLLAFSAR